MSSTSAASKIGRRLVDALDPLSDIGAWNRLLALFNAVWSLDSVRARVVERVDENADTVSLWLKPNRRWRGHRAGQHVELSIEIAGVTRRRVFSLSNAAGSGRLIRLTLRRQAAGGVTDWLHANARPGLVVGIGQASGEFVLPEPTPGRLLMIAGGSGITPLLAMLGHLADQGSTADIMFFQLFGLPAERLFAGELETLAGRLPGLRVISHCSSENGRLGAGELASRVPDLAQRTTLLCGPEALMADVTEAWTALGLNTVLRIERFAAPRPPAGAGSAAQVHAVQSEQVFTQSANLTLLESAEAAGLQPKFGCRAGLCRTCLCRKRSGQVRNLLTGLASDQPDEWVQLCVSVAESDLELVL